MLWITTAEGVEWAERKESKTWGSQGRGKLLQEQRAITGASLWAMPGRDRAAEITLAQCLSCGEVTDNGHRCTWDILRGWLYNRTGKCTLHAPFNREWKYKLVSNTWQQNAEHQQTLKKHRQMIEKVIYLPTYLFQNSSCRETTFTLRPEADFSQARDLKCTTVLLNTAQHSSQLGLFLLGSTVTCMVNKSGQPPTFLYCSHEPTQHRSPLPCLQPHHHHDPSVSPQILFPGCSLPGKSLMFSVQNYICAQLGGKTGEGCKKTLGPEGWQGLDHPK